MALCATRMLRAGGLAKGTLVATVMSNMGLERALAAAGGKLRAHRRSAIATWSKRCGATAELRRRAVGPPDLPRSRHDRRRHRRGAAGARHHAARRAAALRARQGDGARAAGAREREASRAQAARRDGASSRAASRAPKRRSATNGRVLVRWSGTEPKLRLMLEGPDPDALKTMVDEMADAARRDVAANA